LWRRNGAAATLRDVIVNNPGDQHGTTSTLTQEEIDEFLAGWHTMSCATMNHDGTIHLVAMWYGFLEGAWPFGVVEAVWSVVAFRRSAVPK